MSDIKLWFSFAIYFYHRNLRLLGVVSYYACFEMLVIFGEKMEMENFNEKQCYDHLWLHICCVVNFYIAFVVTHDSRTGLCF
jgi:hypothetical protein